jgi:hypothetical protein
MSEPKNTPGPWTAKYDSQLQAAIEIYNTEDRILVAVLPDRGTVEAMPEIEANANLIADAWQLPELRREIKELKAINKEMLGVLKASEELQGDVLMEVSTSQRIFNAVVEYNEKLNKVIRKARGEAE